MVTWQSDYASDCKPEDDRPHVGSIPTVTSKLNESVYKMDKVT